MKSRSSYFLPLLALYMRNLKYKVMDKEKLNSVSAKEIVNIGGQIFYNNCSNKKFKEKKAEKNLIDFSESQPSKTS
jgi:hypothetical protein